MVIDSTHFRHFPCFCQTDCHGSHLGTLRCPECVLSLPRWRRSGPPTHAAYAQTWPWQREVWREVGTEGRSATGGGFSSGWERFPVAPDSPDPCAPPRPVPPLTPDARRTAPAPAPAPEAASPSPASPVPCTLPSGGPGRPPAPAPCVRWSRGWPSAASRQVSSQPYTARHGFPAGALIFVVPKYRVLCSPTRSAELVEEGSRERALPASCVRRRELVTPRRVGEARAALATDGGSVFLEDSVEVSQVLGT